MNETPSPASDLSASLHILLWIIPEQAQRCQNDEITPDHLFLGLCLYPDARPQEDLSDDQPHHKAWASYHAAALAGAARAVDQAFRSASINRLRLFQAVLSATPKPKRVPPVVEGRSIYHRDSQVKNYFSRVEHYPTTVAPLRLLYEMLQNPDGNWPAALRDFEIQNSAPDALLHAARNLCLLDEQHQK